MPNVIVEESVREEYKESALLDIVWILPEIWMILNFYSQLNSRLMMEDIDAPSDME